MASESSEDIVESKLSVVCGAEQDIESCGIFDFLETAASRYPENPWLSTNHGTITYAAGFRIVEQLAAGLIAHGLTKGDRVAICMPNNLAYPLVAYACWRQGIAVVGLNTLYAVPRLKHILSHSAPKLIVVQDERDILPKIQKANSDAKILTFSTTEEDIFGEPSAGTHQHDGTINFAAFLLDAPQVPKEGINPDECIAALQYTGGTTGMPKGAMLTHTNISSCANQLLHGMPEMSEASEKFIAVGPFSHIIGTTLIIVAATAKSAEIAIPPRFHPEDTTTFCLEKRISVIFGVPTMFNAIAHSAAAQDANWSYLKYSMCGGAPLPKQIAVAFQKATSCELLQGYGLSESSSGVCITPPGKHIPEGAVGYPLANSRIEIRSIEDLSLPVEQGKIGEICAGGPQIMLGYWQEPDKTAEAMVDDMLRTGDTGYIDRTGALFLVDRVKDLIIASGYNVYPRLIEDEIYHHPNIREAAVVGVQDAYRGESIKAYVSLKTGTTMELEDLQAFLKDRLSPIEIPRQLEVLDELPKTAIGKISKLDLKSYQK